MEVPVKKYLLLTCLIVAMIISSCSGDTEEVPTNEPEPSSTEPAPALLTVVPRILEPGYPGPEAPDAYPGPADDNGYPAPPLASPTADSYPRGTLFWMLHSAGLQCEEPLLYPELDDAVSALEDKGVTVLESEEVSLAVCQACSCPTSKHYRVQIDANDLISATALGWNRE